MREKIVFVSAIWLLLLTGVGASRAAELVMFESDSCEWCEMWHEEIGVIYAKTDEAGIAPLRRVSIEDPIPGDLEHVRAVHYTPTFVVMEDGEEVGRILGYPGEGFFWGLLDIELKKLKHDAPGGHARSGASGCNESANMENGNEETGDSAAAC